MPRGRPKSKTAVRAVERKPIRPLERQRMRPWLIAILDAQSCEQIRWVNRSEQTFKISWKHAAGQTFDANQDATLFELWARHTGKYITGDVRDPKKWKANFRCAMHSLQDVEEDKSLGVKRGNNAFRVYRFLEERRTRRIMHVKRGRDERSSDEEEDDADCDEEYKVLQNLGTKSRPKKITEDEFDSEGSETGYSPSHSDHSDWALSSEDLRRQDHETESKSPLPNFEELYQSTCNPLIPKSPKKQKRVSESRDIELPDKQEATDTYDGPQYTIFLEDQQMEEDEAEDDMSAYGLNFNEQEVAEATEIIGQDFWSVASDCGVDLHEEVVISGNDGPSVIVMEEQMGGACDYTYTCIDDL